MRTAAGTLSPVQATSTIDAPTAAPLPGPPPRSWARAVADIRDGLRERELWSHLGWQDIKQRYRRSVIGPLWITISMAVTALALGILNAALFGTQIATVLPSITVGLIVWSFVSGCIMDGADTFIVNEGLIKHLPAPLMVYVLRTVWRQILLFAHNLVVYVLVCGIFIWAIDKPYHVIPNGITQPGLNWGIVLAIPAFALIVLNAGWVTVLFGIAATRFRDIPPVVQSFMTLIFYMTPIMWQADLLYTNGRTSSMAHLLALNPFYHVVEIIKAPLVGLQQSWTHWVVVGGFTIVGWALALLALRNYRARVSYWV
ncbi:sugar ABC transporter permease [Gandjariella thermophila]|uniref:Sugar ABC transporter permease n=1 Tax=Gandjariella thermophila TaxID=1931992 RepID=A0A4D4J3H3_9PSEU|nr:sugar ABC transporter permease [Gandjariella thermophila]